MIFLWSNICVLQLLAVLNSNALTLIPSEQTIIKENGTTRTISRFYIRSDENEKDTVLRNNKDNNMSKLVEIKQLDEESDPTKRVVDRYRIYLRRKTKKSKRPVKNGERNSNGVEITFQDNNNSTKSTHLPSVIVRYKKFNSRRPTTVSSTNGESTSTPLHFSSKIRAEKNNAHSISEEEEIRDTSNTVSKHQFSGSFEDQSKGVQQINTNKELTHAASHGDSSKLLTYEEKDSVNIAENGGDIHTDEETITNNIKLYQTIEDQQNDNTEQKNKKRNRQEEDAEFQKLLQFTLEQANLHDVNKYKFKNHDVSQLLEFSSQDVSGQTRPTVHINVPENHPLNPSVIIDNDSLSSYKDQEKHSQKFLDKYKIVKNKSHLSENSEIISSLSNSDLSYSNSIHSGNTDNMGNTGPLHGIIYIQSSNDPHPKQFVNSNRLKDRQQKSRWTIFHESNEKKYVPQGHKGVDLEIVNIKTGYKNQFNPGYKESSQFADLPGYSEIVYTKIPQGENVKQSKQAANSNDISKLQFNDFDSNTYLQSQNFSYILQSQQSSPIKFDSEVQLQKQPHKWLNYPVYVKSYNKQDHTTEKHYMFDDVDD